MGIFHSFEKTTSSIYYHSRKVLNYIHIELNTNSIYYNTNPVTCGRMPFTKWLPPFLKFLPPEAAHHAPGAEWLKVRSYELYVSIVVNRMILYVSVSLNYSEYM